MNPTPLPGPGIPRTPREERFRFALSAAITVLTFVPIPGRTAEPPRSAPVASATADWPGFRGTGNSLAPARQLPLQWSPTHHLAWQVTPAGTGQSSPIVWQETVYLTSVSGPRKDQLVVQGFDLATGQERWRFTTNTALAEPLSDTRSQAAPTPAAGPDGLFAFFESGDCLSLDHQGRPRWHRRLAEEVGELASNHGLGGSPVLAGDLLILPLDQEKPSCLVALDQQTGQTRWKTPRPGRTSWSTPLIINDGPELQVIVSGGGTVNGYRVNDGHPLWEIEGLIKNLVPSPTLGEGLLVIGAGSKGSNVAYDWSGGSQAPGERWRAPDVTTGFASPLIHRGRVYFLSSASVLTCHEAATGRELFSERIPESAWASPLGADDRVYVFGQNGTTLVLKASDTFQPLATNRVTVDSRIVGVAAGADSLLLRSYTRLLCVREAGFIPQWDSTPCGNPDPRSPSR